MESIGDILGKRQDIRENFEKLVAEVLKMLMCKLLLPNIK